MPPIPILRAQNETLLTTTLPPELMGEIFLLACFHTRPLRQIYSRSDAIEICRSIRWSISATCRRWRQIALSTTSLWSRMSLDFQDSKGTYSSFPSRHILDMELQRSSPRHLQVSLNLSISTRASWEEVLPFLQARIIPRCELLELEGHLPQDLPSPLLDCEGKRSSLPHLRALILDEDWYRGDVPHVPKLEYLSLCRITPLSGPIKINNLVQLRVSTSSISFAVPLLLSHPMLETLFLEIGDSDDTTTTVPPIQLLHLRSLSIVSYSAISLFAAIVAPELERLWIKDDNLLPILKHFPNLRFLEFAGDLYRGVNVLFEALQCIPTLVELIISNNDDMLDLILILMRQDKSEAFEVLPALQILECRWYDPETAADLHRLRNGISSNGRSMKFVLYKARNPSYYHLSEEEEPSLPFLLREREDCLHPDNWNLFPFYSIP